MLSAVGCWTTCCVVCCRLLDNLLCCPLYNFNVSLTHPIVADKTVLHVLQSRIIGPQSQTKLCSTYCNAGLLVHRAHPVTRLFRSVHFQKASVQPTEGWCAPTLPSVSDRKGDVMDSQRVLTTRMKASVVS